MKHSYKHSGAHWAFELNEAALTGDMTFGQRIRWLVLMLALGLFALLALWACR